MVFFNLILKMRETGIDIAWSNFVIDKTSHNKRTPSNTADQIEGYRTPRKEREETGLLTF